MTPQYDLVRTVYSSCATLCFSLGMLFNAFLVWLILTKTPAPMLVYSKLLLTPCMMDIFLCFFTFLVQPIPIVDHGYHAVVQNGFFRQMSGIYNYTANVVWFQVLLLSVCATTVQFVFRYYMIFNDGHIPSRLKYITGTVLSLLLFAHVMFHYFSDYPFAKYADEMAQLAIWVHEEVGITDIRFSSFTPARSFIWILHCLAMLIIFGICYAVIVYCARGTCNYIAKAYENASAVGDGAQGGRAGAGRADVKKNEKMREYNNQITTAMIVQAILPTVEVIELTTQVTLPIFVVSGGTVYFMVYAAIPLYFIPVMNPLATMLFVKPYRKALLKLIRKNIGRRNSTMPVQAFQRRAAGIGLTTKATFTDKMVAKRQLRINGGGGTTTDASTEETSSSSTADATAGRIKKQTTLTATGHVRQRQGKPLSADRQHHAIDQQKDFDVCQNGEIEDQNTTPDILDLSLDQLDVMNDQKNLKFSGLNRSQSDAFYYHDDQLAYAQNNSQNTAHRSGKPANGVGQAAITLADQQRSRANTVTAADQQIFMHYKKQSEEAEWADCETTSPLSTTAENE
ncbi:hypothetical protein niasHT_013913 [Heterodera trifolii]|uniref:G protein-coupled receptor n=1 Tax=Heterodera trifolii TaxID=157864 RepID=A0ABD2L1M9_9BILA